MSVSPKQRLSDDALLEQRISEHRIEKNKGLFTSSGLLTALLPAYIYAAVLNYDYTETIGIVLLLTLPIASAYVLSLAYDIMFESEYHKWVHHYDDSKEVGANLQALRIQCALSWAVFFINALFLAVAVFSQTYLFRSVDIRLNFLLTFVLAAGLTLLIASKNEESRKRRKNQQRR